MPSIIIRSAIISDATHIIQFITDLTIFEGVENKDKITVPNIEATLFAKNSAAHCLIAEIDGEPVGLAIYFINHKTWLGQKNSEISLNEYYVSPAHRGKGLGKRLLAELALIANENNCDRVNWHVLDWNLSAVNLFESVGAVEQHKLVGYRLAGDALTNLASQAETP